MSLVAKSFTIYRKTTNAGANLGTDAYIFNNPAADNFKKTAREGAYILTLRRDDAEGIGNKQAAEIDDGNVQRLGIGEGTYVLTGFSSNMRRYTCDGSNQVIKLFRTWKNEAQVITGQLKAGRFGIIDASDSDNSLKPVGTGNNAIGLIFENFSKINDYNRDRVEITLTFRRSRGISI